MAPENIWKKGFYHPEKRFKSIGAQTRVFWSKTGLPQVQKLCFGYLPQDDEHLSSPIPGEEAAPLASNVAKRLVPLLLERLSALLELLEGESKTSGQAEAARMRLLEALEVGRREVLLCFYF